ncbi:UNVERIFIED_CONTAM: hypothetical protein Scaly_1001600 [Sesamum calycinum]|uniref:Uncharacterized protein n=1 Tax=Sesamum calycinum TaxID=2727403 RepID=A0AAW2QZ72_9LAMI
MQTSNQTAILEITVLSAQNLMGIASLAFSRRLRPFITLSADCGTTTSSSKHVKMYKTRVDDKGADIVNRFSTVGPTQFLSYRLRAKDGSRGHGIVNVAVRLEGSLGIVHPPRSLISNAPHLPEVHENDQLVIGIPVKSSNLFS